MENDKQLLSEHLRSVNPSELKQRINRFRNLNIKSMSKDNIRNEIDNVLFWNNQFMCLRIIGTYPKGTLFYRIRKLNGTKISGFFTKYSDFWEPPSTVIAKPGRLNKPQESLLYTTPEDTTVPLLETHIQEGEYFALIHYIANREVKAIMIGGEIDYSANGIKDKTAIQNHEIYKSFLETEFSRDVAEGTEYLYQISEVIAKDHFDLPPRDIQDAWAYISVQDKRKYNVCFRPEIAHEILNLKGAMICKKGTDNSINVYCIAIPSADKSGVEYHLNGSDKQKEVFPDLVKGKQ